MCTVESSMTHEELVEAYHKLVQYLANKESIERRESFNRIHNFIAEHNRKYKTNYVLTVSDVKG